MKGAYLLGSLHDDEEIAIIGLEGVEHPDDAVHVRHLGQKDDLQRDELIVQLEKEKETWLS